MLPLLPEGTALPRFRPDATNPTVAGDAYLSEVVAFLAEAVATWLVSGEDALLG